MEFSDIIEDTPRNNLVIENTLRDIDRDTLITAMAGLPDEVCQAFLRGVSGRTRSSITHGLRVHRNLAGPERSRAAQQHLLQVLRSNSEKLPDEVPAPPETAVPALDLDSPARIVRTFTDLAEFALENRGIKSLERLEKSIEDPFLKKGLEMIVDGWDPLEWRAVLSRRKETCLRALEARLSMIIDGLESLQSGDLPQVVEEKLGAYVAAR